MKISTNKGNFMPSISGIFTTAKKGLNLKYRIIVHRSALKTEDIEKLY